MGIFDKINNTIPPGIKSFLIRAIIAVVSWELLYNFLLKPLRIPDDQLTKGVQWGAMYLLSFFYDNVTEYGKYIMLDGSAAVGIARQCNGLELIVLYLGFIICLPSGFKRMLSFAVIGTVIIYLLNVIRTTILAIMFEHDHAWTDFAHHYVFKIIIYAFVFWGWILYMKKPGNHAAVE